MIILRNKKVMAIIILLVILVVLTIGFIYNKKNNQQSYANEIWIRLTTGDTNSAACVRAKNAFLQIYRFGDRGFDGFYSYKKKRCIGLDERYLIQFDKNDIKKNIGYEDIIFDLITNDIIADCVTDYFSKPNKEAIKCYATGHTATAQPIKIWNISYVDNDMPPDLIYSGVWITLNTLEQE